MDMEMDSPLLSVWFVMIGGVRVYGRCPSCESPRISFYKYRPPGLKGISVRDQGFTPACLDCGQGLPRVVKKETRGLIKVNKRKTFAE